MNPTPPVKLEDIINRALGKDRELRYQGAAEMRSELKLLRRDASSGGRRTSDSDHSSGSQGSASAAVVASSKQFFAYFFSQWHNPCAESLWKFRDIDRRKRAPIRHFCIWLQPLDGKPGRQITQFHSDSILGFSWSPDQKKLHVPRGHLKSDVILLRDTLK